MEVKVTGCIFRQYGDEERKCLICGYVIPSTNDDIKALAETIKSTGENPSCHLKKDSIIIKLKEDESDKRMADL